jgi:hypothetical protein
MPIYSRVKPGHLLGEQWFSKAGLDEQAEIFKLVVASTNKFQAAFLSWLGRCGAAPWLSM